jgi:inhibitor of KinA sporulation pathway (predicted exonuclease)
MIKGDEMNFYVDFEATRFSNRIISIGCTNERGATFKTYVKPKYGKVDDFITELTGITPEMVNNAPSADEAFNAFAKWAYENSENTAPRYYCYGDCDTVFIDATIRTMSDFKAISFAASVKALLIDYAPIVAKYHCTGQVALKKVVALIEDKDEVVQNHDALEDSEMLRTVVENLQSKCTPADASKLATMKSTPKPKTNKNTV